MPVNPVGVGAGAPPVGVGGLYAPRVDNSYTDGTVLRDAHVTKYPERPSSMPALLAFVACNLLVSTLSLAPVNPLPPGANTYDLPPRAAQAPTQSWQYNYEPLLLGGTLQRPDPLTAYRAPPAQTFQYGWTNSVPQLTPPPVVAAPVGAAAFDAPAAARQPAQDWQFTLNSTVLQGMPVGEASYTVPPAAARQPAQDWVFSTPQLNPGVPATRLAGLSSYDLPVTARRLPDYGTVQPVTALQMTDPYYSQVIVLIEAPRALSSTGFVDSSKYQWPVTNVGAVSTSTTQEVFPPAVTASVNVATSAQKLFIADNPTIQLGSSDFTMEMWWYPTSLSGHGGLFSKTWQDGVGGANDGFTLFANGTGMLFYASQSGTSWDLINGASFTVGPTLNAWNHIAVTRQGTNWYGFINGALQMAQSGISGSIFSDSSPLCFGADQNGNSSLPGYIDQIRITKGVARYISAFTPPTAPFFAPPASGAPVGASATDLPYGPRRPTQDWVSTRPVPFTGGAAPVGESWTDLPRGPRYPTQDWVYSTPQLTPTLAFPAGKSSTALPPQGAQQPTPSWAYASPPPYMITLASGYDPYFANVSLLLQGSALPIVDTSSHAQTITNNSVVAQTGTSKFGTPTIDFTTGSSQSLSAAYASWFNWGSNDFTIEAWVYTTSSPGSYHGIFNKEGNGGAATGISLAINGGNLVLSMGSGGSFDIIGTTTIGALSSNTWHFVSLSRNSGTVYVAVDGTNLYTNNIGSASVNNDPVACYVGNRDNGSESLPGYLDQVRVTQGVGRYTGNYSVPTAPFPASGPPVLPAGVQVFDAPPRGAQQPTPAWTATAPMPFTGGAAPVGEAWTDLPRGAARAVDYTWTNAVPQLNPGVVAPIPAGKNVTELPPRGAQQPAPAWASTQPMPFTGGAAPVGETWTALPYGPRQPTQDWVFSTPQLTPPAYPVGKTATDLPYGPRQSAPAWASTQPMPFTGGAAPVGETWTALPYGPRQPTQDWVYSTFAQLLQGQPVGRAAADLPYGARQPTQDWTRGAYIFSPVVYPVGAQAFDLPVRAVPRPTQDWVSTQPMPFTGGAAPVGGASLELPPRGARSAPYTQDWTGATALIQPAPATPAGKQVFDVPLGSRRPPSVDALTNINTRPVPFTGGAAPTGAIFAELPPAGAKRAPSVDALTWVAVPQILPVYPAGSLWTEMPPRGAARAPSVDSLTWTVSPQIQPRFPAGKVSYDLPPRAYTPVPQDWKNTFPVPFTGGAAPVGKTFADLPPRAYPPVPQAFVQSGIEPAGFGAPVHPVGVAVFDLPPRPPSPVPQDWLTRFVLSATWLGYDAGRTVLPNAENRVVTPRAESRIIAPNAEQRVLTVAPNARSA